MNVFRAIRILSLSPLLILLMTGTWTSLRARAGNLPHVRGPDMLDAMDMAIRSGTCAACFRPTPGALQSIPGETSLEFFLILICSAQCRSVLPVVFVSIVINLDEREIPRVWRSPA